MPLWSLCLWQGMGEVWFHWKNSNCCINLCCAANTHLLLGHRNFPSMQCDQDQLCQCSSCWEALLLLMRFGFLKFLLFWENNFLMGFFFPESYVRFPGHPMLSSAEPGTRGLLAAVGRGWCWVSKTLLPTSVWGQTPEFSGVSLCGCGLGSSWQTQVC